MKPTDEHSLMSEILTKPPQKLITQGSILIIACVILFFGLGFIIKVPDIVPAEIEIYNQQSWVDIKTHEAGYVQNILVKNEEEVIKDQALFVIQNSINYTQFLELKAISQMTNEIVAKREEINISSLPDRNKNFGHFQDVYLTLLNKLSDYCSLLTSNEYKERKASLGKLIQEHQNLNKEFAEREYLIKEKLKLQSKQQTRMDTLLKNKIISHSEHEKSLLEELDKKKDLEEAQATLAENRLEVDKLRKDYLDIEWEHKNKKQKLLSNISEANSKLICLLTDWDDQFIFRTPVAGTVNYSITGSSYQYLPAGVVAMTIVPNVKTEIIGRLTCSTRGAGQIEKHQKVRISLSNFPVEDYGFLWAKVENKQETPVNGKYIVEINFPDGLKTTTGANLDFNQYAEGKAEIFIAEKSFVDQIIASFK